VCVCVGMFACVFLCEKKGNWLVKFLEVCACMCMQV